MSEAAVHIRCPAKINLSLSVGPPGLDHMHPIRSWIVAVSLYDDLFVERSERESRFDIGWAEDAPRPSAIDWPVEKDLTYKALQRLGGSVSVRLRKRIPTGAGMGGGSSDAAGMMRALVKLLDLQFPPLQLASLAQTLGSDVPFFLGPPSAIVSGLGEKVEPAPLDGPIYMTLILPDLHCDTATVYRKFDELRPDAKLRDITPATRTEGVLVNDLAEAAFAVEPRLRELRDRCARVAGKSVHVTGSGAGMFIVQPDAASAARTATRLRQQCGIVSVPVRTV
jgi:4-diphosphocytidyl-2-C-methyl-D-erythritol kinase